jgi:glycosyltransferase involved in cell wall biosynthesis
MRKYISIIIPACNEEKVIGKCLNSLKGQKTKDMEIILVNDGSTDRTVEIAKKVKVLDKIINFNKGHSAAFARNRGAEKANGKWLIFIDADMIVESKFIQKVRRFLREKEDDIDGSDYLVFSYSPSTIFQKAWSIYRKCNPSASFPHIIKKETFEKLKGFDEKIFYYEDIDLKERFSKAGYVFEGPISVKVYHIEPKCWNDFIRQRKWQARGILSVIKRKRRIVVLKYFIPILLLPLCYFSFLPLLVYFSYFWFKYSIKTKDWINSFLWVVLDYIGRIISLVYFFREFLFDLLILFKCYQKYLHKK